MTSIITLPTQDRILACMNEHDLHSVSLTCKNLRNAANKDALWASFVERRFLSMQGVDSCKKCVVLFFKSFCTFVVQEYPDIDFKKLHAPHPTPLDVFDRHALMRMFLRSFFKESAFTGGLKQRVRQSAQANSDTCRAIRCLFEAGAKLMQNAAKENGTLHLAIQHMAPKNVIRLLLQARANVVHDHPPKFGTLNQAIEAGHPVDTIQELLNAGAKVEQGATAYKGSLDLALANRQIPDMIGFLLKAGARPLPSRKIDTVHWRLGTLELAIQFDWPVQIIKSILEAKAPLPERSLSEKGVLDFAIEHGASIPVLRLLVNAGAKLRTSKRPELDGIDLRYVADLTFKTPTTVDLARNRGCSQEIIGFLESIEKQEKAGVSKSGSDSSGKEKKEERKS